VSPTVSNATPHAFPFRFVERRLEEDGTARGLVLVTADGAASGGAAWPLSLLAEAAAQAILMAAPPPPGSRVRLVALDRVRQLREVAVGDRLEVEVEPCRTFGSLHRFTCRARCGGALVVTAEVTVRAERGKVCN